VALCERTPAYQGVMRARAEAQAGGEDPEELVAQFRDDEDDEDLEDEVERQDLDDLALTMEVRA
jgi:hypothetical protein